MCVCVCVCVCMRFCVHMCIYMCVWQKAVIKNIGYIKMPKFWQAEQYKNEKFSDRTFLDLYHN